MSQLAIHGGQPSRAKPFPPWPVFGQEEEDRVLAALRSGQWGRLDGEEVDRFESCFAEYHQAKHAVAVTSGTVALRIALLAAGIEAGDEVIVPPYTFLATATAVVECNATPVFADIDLETFNLDPAAVQAAITPRTRAIIPVHMGGLPVDMGAIMEIGRRHDLIVVEDAAHAHGAEYRGGRVGAIGHMGCFSFQSTKNLTGGEGGVIVTNDEQLYQRCRSVHNCGRLVGGAWYEHHVISGNYRLGELQGALLNAQMERFHQQAERRDRNGRYLAQKLAGLDGVRTQVLTDECTRHGFHLFLFRFNPDVLGVSRDAMVAAIEAEGVPACSGYVLPLYRQPLFENLAFGPYRGYEHARPNLDYRKTSCPNCELVCYREGGWLEQRLLLGSTEDMDDIAGAFEKVHSLREQLARDGAQTPG